MQLLNARNRKPQNTVQAVLLYSMHGVEMTMSRGTSINIPELCS